MSYAYKNIKLTFGGDIYNGKDIWSNSLHIGYTGADVDSDPIQPLWSKLVEDLAGDIETWFILNACVSQHANLKWVKIAVLDNAGHYVSEPHIYDFDVPPVGIQPTATAPQLSVVVTFETSVLRGPGRFGRIYPPLSGEVNSAGVDSLSTTRADGAQTLIRDINNTLRLNYLDAFAAPRAIVASKVGAGKNANIIKVKVGQVIDTMRSRRNKFVEDYTERDI